jgi:hypothetical protein
VGSIFFLVGVGLITVMPSWEFPDVLFKVIFPGFGLLAIYAGAYLPKQARETQPAKITFDHEQGAVVIEMNELKDQKGVIRYDEIESFDIYAESRHSNSSNSSRTYYIYHVFLKKKDGGEWHLFEYSKREKAEAMIVQLNAQIPKDTPFTMTISQKLSSKIQRQDGIDKTIIHWQNKVSFAQPIVVFVFSAIFLSILSSIFSFGDIGVLGSIVFGFILLVFLFIITIIIRKLVKDTTTRYAVSVDHHDLDFYEFSKSTGAMRNKKTLSLTEVHSIIYTYAPSKNYQNGGLKILTEADKGREVVYEQKPMEAVKDMFSSEKQPITLSITALNPVECLQLENWLQELILKKGNVRVQ